VLQSEYHTWLKYDKHSQAYSILLNEESKRIGTNLGIKAPHEAPLCLDCHATHVEDPSLRGEKYQLEDGVSCESCHGAAEKWLDTHTQKGATHQQNLENGLFDSAPLENRAKLCLSCHYGNEQKTVNHRLYGAGHPRLSFELDTFSVLEPKHWVVDEDYEQRKGGYIPAGAWLSGQIEQARQVLAALESPTRSKTGNLPELSLFDCYSCHHSLTEDQWKKRSYDSRPGELNLNLPALFVLREAVLALDPKVGAELKAQIDDLHVHYKDNGGKNSIPSLKSLLSAKVPTLTSKLASSETSARAVLKQLAAFAATSQWLKYEVAEQVAMAFQAILATHKAIGSQYKSELDVIFASLNNSEAFSPEKFTEAAGRLAKRL
jgi:hypothetical protein